MLLRQAEIPFQEIQLKFAQDVSVIGVGKYSPTRKVPVLLVDGEPVWDTLAICETAAELSRRSSCGRRRPAPAASRSVCAEMHSGFQALRSRMPMNIRGRYPARD